MLVSDSLFSISKKTILITGGLGLLGKVFTNALLAAGATVYCLDLAEHGISFDSDAIEIPEKFRNNLHYVQADITNKQSLTKVRDLITSNSKTLDVLINNAALNPKVEKAGSSSSTSYNFEDMPLATWEKELQVNLTGTMLCCQTLSPVLASNASVINIASIYGVVAPKPSLYPEGFFKPAAYGVSKAGVINLTKYLAVYWAGRNIRVNCVVFGGVQNGQAQSFVQKYSAETPLGRMAQPTDFVGILQYLASDASTYSTGSVYTVDGGWTAL